MAQNNEQPVALGEDIAEASATEQPDLSNVLIARFSALGDVVMSIPVVYSVCKRYPGIRFIFVTRPSMTGIFLNKPGNLEVCGADVKEEYRGVGGMRRLARDLDKKYGIDAFVDLHDVLRTKMLRAFMRLRGKKVAKIDKDRASKRALTRARNKVMRQLPSSTERYRQAFAMAGLPFEFSFDGLFGGRGKASPKLFEQIVANAKPVGEKWIGIAPFAAHEAKVYPIEMMEQVVAKLSARGDARIFILGAGAAEDAVAEAWAKKYPGVTSLAGKRYGFAAELALMNHFDAMVTMDSANMHMASICNAPLLSIWGATHPYCGFAGWEQTESSMIQAHMACRPCSVFGEKKCQRGDLLCLRSHSPEIVYNKICKLIDNV